MSHLPSGRVFQLPQPQKEWTYGPWDIAMSHPPLHGIKNGGPRGTGLMLGSVGSSRAEVWSAGFPGARPREQAVPTRLAAVPHRCLEETAGVSRSPTRPLAPPLLGPRSPC